MADDLAQQHARRERLALERLEHQLRARTERRRAEPLRAAAAERPLTAAERARLDGALDRAAAHDRRQLAIAQELVDLNRRIDRATLARLAALARPRSDP